MSDSSRAQLRFIEEVTWGDTPASNMTDLRMTGESLSFEVGTASSSEIRSDRQLTDLIQTSFQAGGGFNFELSADTYDRFLESAMFDDFGSVVAVAESDISASSVDNSYNTASGNFTAEGISVGQWLLVAGFTGNAANNGIAKVVSVATGKLVVAGLTLVTEIAGDSITIGGSMLRNGIAEKSFTLEKEFSDIAQFISYTGMIVNTMELSVSAQEILTGSFAFIGKNSDITQTTVGTGGATAATSTKVMDAGNSVGNIREAGSAITNGLIQSLSISVNNNLRGQPAVAVIGNADISSGTLGVEGSLNAYFVDEVLYEKYIDGTESSIDFVLSDGNGGIYVITLPRVKYNSSEVVAGGINSDVMANLGYTALRDPATDCMIQIDKL